jgi:hypothetical protein
MRSYPTDSPQAAARIVALTLVADGHVSKVEMNALERLDAYQQLGIDRQGMHGVLQGLCEDLLQGQHSQWADACRVEPWTLNQVMAEVQERPLRLTVLRLCVAVAEADDLVTDGEALILVNAVEQWGLHHEMLGTSQAVASH